MILFLIAWLAFQAPTFEVASVKPSDAEPGNSGGFSGRGRYTMHNVTLRRLIRGAYDVPEAQIFGGPKWIAEDRFDIDAKAATASGDHDLMLMLQSLLAERFQLTLHRETRQMAGYAVVIAKGGLKAKPSESGADCRSGSRKNGVNAYGCGAAQLAMKLTEVLHMPVADMTELAGKYDFKLEFTPDSDTGPSIFAAMQEQLGLRLEGRKVPTEVLIIERAEKPSAN